MLKSLAGLALLRTGLWDRTLRVWARRQEAIILTYHRVIEKWDRTLDYSQPGMVVTADTFDRQLRFLKEHFDIVPLSLFSDLPAAPPGQRPFRAGGCCQRPALRRPLCAITFDDGWRDNYEIAFPILRKYELPATIFLTTDFIGTDRVFWHTELLYLLLHQQLSVLRQSPSDFRAYPSPVRQGLRRLAMMQAPRQAKDADSLVEAVKDTCDEDSIERLVRDLAESIGLSRPLFPGRTFFLDWNHVREMAAAGVEIGSHGCSHRILTRLNAQEAEDELVRSKGEIERRIAQEVRHFAFPNEAANQDLVAMAEKVGYRTACPSGSGPVQRQSNLVPLRRAGMAEGVSLGDNRSCSEAPFLLWLARAPRVRAS